jgi:hypothetical protein
MRNGINRNLQVGGYDVAKMDLGYRGYGLVQCLFPQSSFSEQQPSINPRQDIG